MPSGFNALAIKSYLVKTWGMEPMHSDAVLLLATTLEPPKRLSSEAEARMWLDNVVSLYSQHAGIQLLSGVAAGSSGGSSTGVIKSSKLIKASSLHSRSKYTCAIWVTISVLATLHSTREE